MKEKTQNEVWTPFPQGIRILKIHLRVGDSYLCNQTCYITEEKCTYEKEEVTCLNCLRLLKNDKT